MNITLKRLKVCNNLSEETLAFTADILLDGRMVGEASNQGHGGCNMYYWNDCAVGGRIEAWAKALPKVKTQYGELENDLDLVIGDMIEKEQETKDLRRWCKTKVVFRLKGAKPGEWIAVKAVFTPEIKARLAAKHDIECFANEMPGVANP